MRKILVIMMLCLVCNATVEAKGKKTETEHKTIPELMKEINTLKHKISRANEENSIFRRCGMTDENGIVRTNNKNIEAWKKHIDDKFNQIVEQVKTKDIQVDNAKIVYYRNGHYDMLYSEYNIETYLPRYGCYGTIVINYIDGTSETIDSWKLYPN